MKSYRRLMWTMVVSFGVGGFAASVIDVGITFHTISWAVLASLGLSGAAIHFLHRRTKPAAYTIAEIEVTDPLGYQEYVQATTSAVPRWGGRFIVRAGKTFVVNGTPPKRIAVIKWKDYEKAQAFFNSEAYKQLIGIRDRSAKFRAFVIEGTL
jgi:uncharacterized protein (DUF1330 family)